MYQVKAGGADAGADFQLGLDGGGLCHDVGDAPTASSVGRGSRWIPAEVIDQMPVSD
jgi:hypothetical protein